MMDYYYKHLRERVKQKKAFPTDIEKAIICAIDFHNAHSDFDIFIFFKNEYYYCSCKASQDAKGRTRYSIEKLKCYKHSLSELYSENTYDGTTLMKYEEAYYKKDGAAQVDFEESYRLGYPEIEDYNKKIQKALGEISSDSKKPIFVSGEYVNKRAVLYALQTQLGIVNYVELKKTELNIKSRFNFSDKVLNGVIRMSEEVRINDYLGNNQLTVFVPSDNQTLNSSFWGNILWKDIIPQECLMCEIENIPCYRVDISFEVDGFNNIFCRVNDNCGHEYYDIIDARFGNYLNSKSNAVDKEEHPIVSSQEHLSVNNSIAKCKTETVANSNNVSEKELESDKETSNMLNETYKTETFKINEGDTYDYTSIFNIKYIQNAEEIIIQDPYIYLPHHFNNVINFVKALKTEFYDKKVQNTIRRIIIETKKANKGMVRPKEQKDVKKGKISESEYLTKVQEEQENGFERLNQILGKNNIQFSYKYVSKIIHEREVKFSNGWTVVLGRGLDIFKRRGDITQPILCHDCNVTYKFGNGDKSIPRDTRKLHSK